MELGIERRRSEIEVRRKPVVIVVSGPSGAGKSTIVKKVLERDKEISLSVSLTTRPPRPGEKEGREYRFVSEEEFVRIRDSGGLLEWAEVYGHFYGTPREPIEARLGEGRDVLLEIDVQGGMQVRENMEEAVMVFIVPPGMEELERRLRGRGTDSDEVIRERLAGALRELEYNTKYDYVVINDSVDECVADVLCIINAERLRRERTAIDF